MRYTDLSPSVASKARKGEERAVVVEPSTVCLCVSAHINLCVFPESENNLMWAFWCRDTMWCLQWPKNWLWCKQQGRGTEAIDKSQRQREGVQEVWKTEGDIVDTLYVYLPAGALWLNLLSPSFLCSSPCLLCPLSAPSGHTSWQHAAGLPHWEVEEGGRRGGHRWEERSHQHLQCDSKILH